ncbi:three component ABC system middle component [Undibacterium sp. Tian12W]|uniref:three component ABC system middle component n=1 Tax=Undibacterium sp. Tian12W TaxID=3413054 RepID=UPI003BF458F8
MSNHGYIDQNLIQNSALACFLLVSFVHSYEQLTAKTASPELMKLLLILPICWHKASCSAIQSRQASTPLHAVLSDSPLIKVDFQDRISAFSAATLQGLNLGCASGLLERKFDRDVPCLTTTFDRWPQKSKPVTAPAEMLNAIDRLANWFKDASTAELYSQFLRK